MKREVKERSPEELAALQQENKRQYSLVAAIIWTLCSVAWVVTLCLDFTNDGAILQIVLHFICAALTATSAVLHFLNWRKMKQPSAAPDDDTLDSEDK